jgi:hypothetical protein
MRRLLCAVIDDSASLEGVSFNQQWRDDELRWIKQAEAMQLYCLPGTLQGAPNRSTGYGAFNKVSVRYLRLNTSGLATGP